MNEKTSNTYIVSPRWLITCDSDSQVLENHSLLIDNGIIAAILSEQQLQTHRSSQTTEVLELPDHALMPGMINAHGHLAMSLFRGLADDKPLQSWLEEDIWPAEGRWVDEQFVRDGTELAMAEMLLSGTTTCSDMYFFPEVCASVASDIGMRLQIAFPILDFPTAWGQGPDDYISKGSVLHDEYRDHEYVSVAFGPHAPYTVAEPVLNRIASMVNEIDAAVQIHVQETLAELQDFRRNHGLTPIEKLAELGLLSPKTQCVHLVHLGDNDATLLAEHNAHAIHCPQSNLKLAAGFSPVSDLSKSGVNVALGTDSAASNNALDMFQEMKTAALIAKASSVDAKAVPAEEALKMATINGAKALGIAHKTGSLEVGKAADMIAINTAKPRLNPIYDIVSQKTRHYLNIFHHFL